MTVTIDDIGAALVGMKISHIWRGYGSAIFLEFGDLSPCAKRDGSCSSLQGELGVMIEWSWRIEADCSIICGSWSDEALWRPAFDRLVGRDVICFSTFGRLPELSIGLVRGLHIRSFMTAEGDPAWTVFDRRREGKPLALHCRSGEIVREC